ncbi:DUF7342 family protein [Halorussus litoreus]|uniref:DUF7342 family protein n=1 Tax=Halorussus litoreus TaxID=1710536 RepID=UPI000E246C2D|nr:ArsR family transcriptional regulator [Halorussus litoreus]
MSELPPDGEDVNEHVVDEWVEATTPFERVRTVMKRTYEAESAPTIAERARTTPTTARTHLQQLADSGFVDEVPASGGTTVYERSNESLVLEQAHDILDATSTERLVDRIGEMREEIRAYRNELDADSPEDAAIRDCDVDSETLREWQTTRRNLDIAKAALALSQAEETVQRTKAV